MLSAILLDFKVRLMKNILREWIRGHLVYYEEVTRGDLPGLLLSRYCPQVVPTTPVFISPALHNVEAPL
jgi:hypothetical protein